MRVYEIELTRDGESDTMFLGSATEANRIGKTEGDCAIVEVIHLVEVNLNQRNVLNLLNQQRTERVILKTYKPGEAK